MKIQRTHVTTYDEEIPATLAQFMGWEFSSGPTTEMDFRVFARLLRKHIQKVLPDGVQLEKFNAGHYYISGFLGKGGRYAYFSTSDVRHIPGQWHRNILIRTAKTTSDYTGESNGYTSLANFSQNVERLLN